MSRTLHTIQIHNLRDIKAHFDACSNHYQEQHGNAKQLLDYRISLIKRGARLQKTDVVLDIGCGPGEHLRALAPLIKHGIGVDLSSGMIQEAKRRVKGQLEHERLSFIIDNGETLSRIQDESVDVALTVGTLEHVLDKESLVKSTYRKLKSRGRWMILTLNGNYIWYRFLAPKIGLDTKHLSTDKFLTQTEIKLLLSKAGFMNINITPWTFIPHGDIMVVWSIILKFLDRIGRRLNAFDFRGGLAVRAEKI